jgi:hypothetical protein
MGILKTKTIKAGGGIGARFCGNVVPPRTVLRRRAASSPTQQDTIGKFWQRLFRRGDSHPAQKSSTNHTKPNTITKL